jgi:hypothetical protein
MFLKNVLLEPEDGRDIILRNNGHSPIYRSLQSGRPHFSIFHKFSSFLHFLYFSKCWRARRTAWSTPSPTGVHGQIPEDHSHDILDSSGQQWTNNIIRWHGVMQQYCLVPTVDQRSHHKIFHKRQVCLILTWASEHSSTIHITMFSDEAKFYLNREVNNIINALQVEQ